MLTCVLTLLLVVGSVESHQPTTYDNPRLYGDCLVRHVSLSIFISPYAPELVITREFDQFRIVLPEETGSYELQYVFSQEFAELWPKGKIIVRHGPRGFW